MTSLNSLSVKSSALAVAKYAVMPGFWPRLVDLMPRFGMLAYFMALIFEAVRLLPTGHPLLNPSRMGTYRIRDVLAAAANNLKGGIGNCDQYIIFGMFVIGTVLLAVQFILLFSIVVVGTAHAATAIPFVSMFVTAIPTVDIAHLMLDRVFGIPEFFNSCFDPVANAAAGAVCDGFTPTASFPTPFQTAMQYMFRFYSMGMLAVAGFMLLYYIFAMLAETVNTGVPFGKRFQSFYSPIRMIIAVLLLLPLAHGYNTGQYIVLLTAKWGSAFGTNAWYVFNNRVGDNPLGLEPQQMVGAPKVQDIESIINFFYIAQTCRAAYWHAYQKDILPYLVRPVTTTDPASAQLVASGTTFTAARNFYGQSDVNIVFGDIDDSYTKYPANVKPYCGVMSIPALSKTVEGIEDIYNVYFQAIMNMWFNDDMTAYGTRMSCNLRFADKSECDGLPGTTIGWDARDDAPAGQGFYMNMRLDRQSNYTAQMDQQIDTLRTTSNSEVLMDSRILLFGWGGAGMWFNKLMSFNGALVDALMILPSPTQYPMVMEAVAAKKRAFEKNTSPKDKYTTTTASGNKTITLDKQMGDTGLDNPSTDVSIASLLDAVYQQVQNSEATSKPRSGNSDNPVKTFVSLLFGETGLLNFTANGDVFPLVKLATLGREIIDKTIIMIAAGGLITGLGGIVGAEMGPFGEILRGLGSTMMTFATMGITVGVLLYYIIPMMPFIYFFFAVGRWVKSVLEAMIAIPLWALAHMRLGGEGIPGSAASQGYFLILEILLRPIISIFGLLASVACFAAMDVALDSVFNLAVMNVGGYDMTALSGGGADTFMNSARDGVDALFYTILYVIIVYMMATSSFKLIEIFPSSIMRWAGTNSSAFNDGTDVATLIDRHLTQEVYQTANQLRGTTSSVADAINLNKNLQG